MNELHKDCRCMTTETKRFYTTAWEIKGEFIVFTITQKEPMY